MKEKLVILHTRCPKVVNTFKPELVEKTPATADTSTFECPLCHLTIAVTTTKEPAV